MTNLSQVIQSAVSCRVGLGGEGLARQTLLIHGLGESSLCFQSVLSSSLLENWTLLAPDLPGYGQSPAGRIHSLLDYSALLADWIGASEESRLVVLGHSMGGVIGQYLCRRIPDRIAAFVNVEGNLSREDCTYSSPAAVLSEREFLESGFDRLIVQVAQTGKSDPASASYATSMRVCDPAQFHASSRELVEVSAGEQLAGEMASSPVPTLYIAGLRERTLSRTLQLLEENGVSWLGFEQSGHWPFIDESARFNTLLKGLLEVLQSELGQTR